MLAGGFDTILPSVSVGVGGGWISTGCGADRTNRFARAAAASIGGEEREMGHGVPRRGATKVEYALMLLVISLTCVFFAQLLGEGVAVVYDGARMPVHMRTRDAPPPAAPPKPGETPGGDTDTSGDRGGNPGNGNAGNDKSVGNAPR